ncbi:disease resistance protein RPV1-like [Hevea brasiliensis]|uniref:disease resistance protein RPV1-like n=1 Tax=Hevea brasiliensis TaxID=3981 RepID=UPI0025D765F0|nr:disease resistance protein RPV1-like [Hevea brasiliensis]
MENLVHLIMPCSKVEELWNGSTCFPNLKSLDLTRSKHLKIVPDFSMMTNLEEINFDGCKSLIEIPSSIHCLKRLRSLSLNGCKKLRSLPQIPRGIKYLYLRYSGVKEWSPSSIQFLDNLLVLHIAHCENLRSLPRIIYCNTFMRLDISFCPNLIMAPQIMESSEVLPSSNNGIVELDLRGCKMLNGLPNSTCELKRLEILCLHGCSNLEKLPPLYGLLSLRYLYLDGTALVEIPPDIVSLSSLELLSLSDTPMEELPSSIGCLTSLVSLRLQRCKKLKSLSNSICQLKCLERLFLSGCSNLEKLPPLYGLCSLKQLLLGGTACNALTVEELSSSIGCLSSLFSLCFNGCKKLKSLPNSICQLKCLERLFLSGCSNLEKLPLLYGLCSLKKLFLDGTALVEIPPDIVYLSSLELLSLSDTPIEELPSSIGCLSSLFSLCLNGCKKFKSLPNSICQLKCLERLFLSGCSNLEKLPPLYGLCSLKKLFLDGTALVEIPPDIVSLSSLEVLSLSDTPIEELPSSIGCLSSLFSLCLNGCKKLKSLPNSICQLKCLERLFLSSCSNLEKLPPLYGLCSLKGPYIDGTALVEIPPDTASLSSLRRLSLKDCNRLQKSCNRLQKSVSTSYIAPIKYREECREYGYELNFCNCLNLDQNARGTIMADALRRIKELAIARCVGAFYPYFYVGLPGGKIPEWLSCEGPGNSMATFFPPGCFNNMFLGFVFCAIIEFKDPGFRVRDLHLICQSSFKNNNGYREASFTSEYFCLENTIESDHVFFWYDGRDISYLDWLKQNCDMENEASFYLYPDIMDTDYMTKWEVKRFGFHLLCDKVELNKCNPYICREANFLEQFKETTNANNKRSREDFYSSNINGNQEVETHPKRLRKNFQILRMGLTMTLLWFLQVLHVNLLPNSTNFFEIRPY